MFGEQLFFGHFVSISFEFHKRSSIINGRIDAVGDPAFGRVVLFFFLLLVF
jgi:hypothetical protein